MLEIKSTSKFNFLIGDTKNNFMSLGGKLYIVYNNYPGSYLYNHLCLLYPRYSV